MSENKKETPPTEIKSPPVHLPWGDASNHVRLKDGLDVRPAADLIVKNILKRKKEKGEQNLVVGLGEIHAYPTHYLTQQLVANRLLDCNEPFKFALERDSDILDQILKINGISLGPHFSRASDYDPIGQAELLGQIVCVPSIMSRLGARSLEVFLWTHQIPTKSIDVPKTAFSIVDGIPQLGELLLNAEEKSVFGDVRIETNSPEAWLLRNKRMVAVLKQAEGINLVGIGQRHLFGSTSQEYESCFHRLFSEEQFLPVLLDLESASSMAQPYLQETVSIQGLSNRSFMIEPNGQYPEEEEQAYIEEICWKSGAEVSWVFPPHNVLKKEATKAMFNVLTAMNKDGCGIEIPENWKPQPSSPSFKERFLRRLGF